MYIRKVSSHDEKGGCRRVGRVHVGYILAHCLSDGNRNEQNMTHVGQRTKNQYGVVAMNLREYSKDARYVALGSENSSASSEDRAAQQLSDPLRRYL